MRETTMQPKISLAKGLLIERIGGALLVVVPGKSEVIRLDGEAAELVVALSESRALEADETLLSELRELGIVGAAGLSRRSLVKAGAVGIGAGIAVLSMPSVAVASSTCNDGGSGTYRDYGGGLTAFRWNAPDYPTPSAHGAIQLSNGETISPDGYTTDSGLEIVGLDWVGAFSGLNDGNPVTGEFTYGEACYQVTFSLIIL